MPAGGTKQNPFQDRRPRSVIASLCMYARPELVEAHTAYWAIIRHNLRQRGIDAPQALSQDAEPFSVWRHPALVLSQTCGLPYRMYLHDDVALVGTPDFGLEGCEPGYYRCPLLVRADESRADLALFEQAVFAFNEEISQSGFAAARSHLAPYGFWFKKRLHTGQHRESARAVAQGHADLACLDAVSWRLIQQYDGFATQLKVLQWTDPTPGLPYISSVGADAKAIYSALERSIAELPIYVRELLGLKGMVYIAKADYLAVGA